MIKIGLTGGIASGKSTISKILKGLGAKIIDADIEAKAALKPNAEPWQLLIKEFGKEILKNDQSIDRRKLGNMVFGDKQKLNKLNSIVHPFVIERIKGKIAYMEQKGDIKAVVLDAPLLIETNLHNLVDEVWVVDVDTKTQISRLIKRDKYNEEQAKNRLKAQLSQEERLKYATAVIDNTGGRRHTREQVTKLWNNRVEELN
ncbi:dephospho-CoA kinase [Alkalicella caledoniensis]|uniref:Dephospho-CoA kinase n=1 Tax=Alkalicella caledoniensis TaxID=2731377 RepID=A0A7G9WAH6_ALKCA|nr:dephospho-CoA kinase [Alkalicella caledoniensis]QNO15688.1 dephospho-CoA kinase [Alkalicella caledoniensis]